MCHQESKLLFWEYKRLSTGWAGHASFEEVFLFWERIWMVLCLHTCSVLMEQCFVWRQECRKSVTGALKRQDVQNCSHFMQKIDCPESHHHGWFRGVIKAETTWTLNEWMSEATLCFWNSERENMRTSMPFIHIYVPLCVYCLYQYWPIIFSVADISNWSYGCYEHFKKGANLRNKKNTRKPDLRIGCKVKGSCCLVLTV